MSTKITEFSSATIPSNTRQWQGSTPSNLRCTLYLLDVLKCTPQRPHQPHRSDRGDRGDRASISGWWFANLRRVQGGFVRVRYRCGAVKSCREGGWVSQLSRRPGTCFSDGRTKVSTDFQSTVELGPKDIPIGPGPLGFTLRHDQWDWHLPFS